ETTGPQLYDWLSLLLNIVALIIDTIALSAIVFRLSSFGVTPNKLAALGENVLVFINLFGMALLFVQFIRRKISFVLLEKWQTGLLPFYALWLGFVALIFPLIFSFV
ncbi:MAG: permease prefix domain 1-containing protein, partial [Candidatus Latescibacterota bacterium]